MDKEQYVTDALAHARETPDAEACGLVVIHRGRKIYVRCGNAAEDASSNFIIPAKDWVAADHLGEVVGIVHSHPDRRPLPSQADLVSCERSGLPWTIVNPRTGEFHVFEPSGYAAPLYGREYCFGVLDCYTFVQDYYRQTYGIVLRDYEREERFWEKGQELYLDHLEAEGFYRIDEKDARPGDSIIMNIDSDIGNHAGVYVGDGLFGHHLCKRLSSRDIYGGYYRKHTLMFVRHREVNQ